MQHICSIRIHRAQTPRGAIGRLDEEAMEKKWNTHDNNTVEYDLKIEQLRHISSIRVCKSRLNTNDDEYISIHIRSACQKCLYDEEHQLNGQLMYLSCVTTIWPIPHHYDVY